MLSLAGQGMDEARRIVAAVEGLDEPGALPGWAMWLVLAASPAVFPFPIEAYLKFHFTKVGDQTRLNIAAYIEEGKRRGLPTAALEDLTSRVPPVPGDPLPS